jgi:hypothetical protein
VQGIASKVVDAVLNIGYVTTFSPDEVTFDSSSKIGTELPKTSLFRIDFLFFLYKLLRGGGGGNLKRRNKE